MKEYVFTQALLSYFTGFRCYSRQSVGSGLITRLMFLIAVLTINDAHAEFHELTINGSAQYAFENSDPTWTMDVDSSKYVLDSEAAWSDIQDAYCVQLIVQHGVVGALSLQRSAVFNQSAQIQRTVGEYQNTASCGADQRQGAFLTFNVYFTIPQNVRDAARLPGSNLSIRFSLDSGLTNTDTAVAQLVWRLEAQNQAGQWVDLGGLNRLTASPSSWVMDPENPHNHALHLVGVFDDDALAEDHTTASSADSAVQISSIEFDDVIDGSGAQEYSRFADARPPIIEWGKGQSDRDLYMQVVSSESSPMTRFVCLRAVYQSAGGGFRYLEQNQRNHWIVRSNTTPLHELAVPGDGCFSKNQLLIPVYINASAETLSDQTLRFRITDKLRSKREFDLSNATIELINNDSKKVLAKLSAPDSQTPGRVGRWAEDEAGRVFGILDGDGVTSSQSTQIEYLATADEGQNIRGALYKNGEGWQLDSAPSALTEPILVQWESNRLSPQKILLCDTANCDGQSLEIPTSENQFEITPDSLPSRLLFLVIDWRKSDSRTDNVVKESSVVSEPNAISKTAEAASGTAGTLVFSPTVAFGEQKQPLTVCLGQMVLPDGSVSPVFSLRNGRQEMTDATSVLNLPDDEWVHVSYGAARGGGKCPVEGLRSEDLRVGDIRQSMLAGDIAQQLTIDKPLFTGYLHLNGAEYKQSLARWREFLQFFDRLYSYGRGSSWWVDGVVFGASAERDNVSTLIRPSGNFVTSLGDDDRFVAVAEGAIQNRRARGEFFEAQLNTLAQKIGDSSIGLVYFDDLSSGCGDYINTVERSGLTVVSGVIITARTENLTGSKSIRTIGGGVADVCEESDAITVYAIDANERTGNRDWDKALTAILEDVLS